MLVRNHLKQLSPLLLHCKYHQLVDVQERIKLGKHGLFVRLSDSIIESVEVHVVIVPTSVNFHYLKENHELGKLRLTTDSHAIGETNDTCLHLSEQGDQCVDHDHYVTLV